MSSYNLIDKTDTRFETLKKGFNLRWPDQGSGADYIYVCNNSEDVLSAANAALARNQRITVRSGGHCYEGFVSNKLAADGTTPLAIIDLSLLVGMDFSENADISSPWDTSAKYKFRAASGNQNWDGTVNLYKLANRSIPGGSCYSVGAGGHISGGGYGLLSRLHGLTVDWLSGVDILVPAADGKSLLAKHVSLKSTGSDRDLFIACRGAGGGNFGIILNYYFAELPAAPEQVYLLSLAWPWSTFKDKAHFGQFLNSYWQWFNTHDSEWNSQDITKANGGLFSLLKLQHRSTGEIHLLIQYTGNDGRVDGSGQEKPFADFVDTMNKAAGVVPDVIEMGMTYGVVNAQAESKRKFKDAVSDARLIDWLYATQTLNGSGDNQRGKYKSDQQIGNFGATEITALWEGLNGADDPLLNQALVQIDSYGGCINTNDETTNPTSVYQRSSLLKAQFQVYWTDKANDQYCINWMQKLYSACFADQGGKPYGNDGRYQGCYINYPDTDMKYTAADHAKVDPEWLTLYYGDKAESLVKTKQAVDPKNLFRHEMSIPLVLPAK